MKKVMALLLALLMMAGLMAGCGGGGEENPSSEPTQTGGDTASTEPSAAPSFDPSELDSMEPAEYELPLVEDYYEFEYWMQSPGTFDGFTSMDDNLFFQWMEERTGVHLVFNHPPVGSVSETFQTMILSNDLPDFIQGINSYYSGGVDKAVADNVLKPLNDEDNLIDLMPHYKSIVYSDQSTFIQAVSDAGNLWAVHNIRDTPQGAFMGGGIRQDWLDDLGIDISEAETVDGLENILTQFKTITYDNESPLWMEGGNQYYGRFLSGSYGVQGVNDGSGIIQHDGTAVYSPLEPSYKDYVAKMADWYQKGLINVNYVAEQSVLTPDEYWVNGEVGVGEFVYTYLPSYKAAAATSSLQPDPDFNLSAIASPKLDASQSWSDIHLRNSSDRIRTTNSAAFTTQCSDFELAARYWDYIWTDEGIMASNWGPTEGPEGDLNSTYFVDPTDANGDGHNECFQPWLMTAYGNVNQVQTKVSANNCPGYGIWSREWCVLSEQEIEYQHIWDQVGNEYCWPVGVTLSADEGAAASSILTDCNTLVNEWTAAVITGEKSVDTYDTELVPQLKNYRIDEAIGYYQAALARYNDRVEYMG